MYVEDITGVGWSWLVPACPWSASSLSLLLLPGVVVATAIIIVVAGVSEGS